MVGAPVIANSRFIFVHVPKTGGKSITAALGGVTPGVHTHTPLRVMHVTNEFTFGFARNPWARMVSLYRFMCQKEFKPTDAFDQDETRAIGFKAWLTTGSFHMKEDREWMTPDLPPMQRRPQMWWLEGCDFMGRLEDIDADWPVVTALAGIRPIPSLPHINTTSGGDWRDEYDAESREFIAEHFAPDIERFGYRW